MKWLAVFAGGLLLLFISMLTALCYGTVSLEWKVIWQTIFQEFFTSHVFIYGTVDPVHDIVWLLRLPRVLLAAAVGAGLAVSGTVMQAVVKNPLADPYILGISAGASLGATIGVFGGLEKYFGMYAVGVSAFLGALCIAWLVTAASCGSPRGSAVKLLLVGMAFNAVCSALTGGIVYFANSMEGIQTITYWLMGSLSGASWETLLLAYPAVGAGILFFWTRSRVLNLMLIGEESAITLGYELRRHRNIFLGVTALLVGTAVFSAGIIGFLGLLIPHIVRMITGNNHKTLIPFAALGGAVFLVWADLACWIVIRGTELPIGILVSSIGGPVFILLLLKSRYGFGGE